MKLHCKFHCFQVIHRLMVSICFNPQTNIHQQRQNDTSSQKLPDVGMIQNRWENKNATNLICWAMKLTLAWVLHDLFNQNQKHPKAHITLSTWYLTNYSWLVYSIPYCWLHHVTSCYIMLHLIWSSLFTRSFSADFVLPTSIRAWPNLETMNLMVAKPHSPVFDGHWRIHVYPLTQTHLRVAPPDRFPLLGSTRCVFFIILRIPPWNS